MKVGEDLRPDRGVTVDHAQLPDPASAAVPPERLATSDLGSGSMSARRGWNLRRGVFSQFGFGARWRVVFSHKMRAFMATSSRPACVCRR
jgi:hypothetical protein